MVGLYVLDILYFGTSTCFAFGTRDMSLQLAQATRSAMEVAARRRSSQARIVFNESAAWDIRGPVRDAKRR